MKRTFTLTVTVEGNTLVADLTRENVVSILAHSTVREAIEEGIMSYHGPSEVTFEVSDLIVTEWPDERTWYARTIPAPFDTDEYPKAVLLQGDDVATSTCGRCIMPAGEWPYNSSWVPPNARPGVMYQAELFCTQCFPYAFDEHTGRRVNAFSGFTLSEGEPGPAGRSYRERHERQEKGLR